MESLIERLELMLEVVRLIEVSSDASNLLGLGLDPAPLHHRCEHLGSYVSVGLLDIIAMLTSCAGFGWRR